MLADKRKLSLYALTALLLTIAPIVHLIFSITFSYWTLGEAIQPVILSNLSSAMDLRRLQVQNYFDAQEHDTQHLAKQTALLDGIDQLIENPRDDKALSKIIKSKQWRPPINDAKIFDTVGNLIFSLSAIKGEERRIQSLIPRQVSSEVYTILDSDKGTRSRLVHSLPIETTRGFSGTLVIEKELTSLDEFLLDRRGLQKTGESLLLRQDERGSLRYASPLRFPEKYPDAMAISTKVEELLKTSVPTGLSAITDYRGVQTFSMFSKLPIKGLYLMVKVDQSEAFSPLTMLRQRSIAISVGGIAFAILLAFIFSRSIKRSLLQVISSAHEIEHGNYTVRAPVSRVKEVGELGQAFNRMADALANAIGEKNSSIQELEYFSRYATHDLNEPTKKLKRGCQIIKESSPESIPPEVLEIIDQLEFSADSMHDVISGMRTLSTLSKFPLTRTHIQIEEMLLPLLTTFSRFLENSKTQVVLTSLPTVYASEQLLPYLYRNLTQTLVQLGDVGRRIMTFTAEPVGDSWILGIKVTPRLFSRVGEPSRVYTASELKYKFHDHDRGMGLALCRKIVARHDGEIWVTDADSTGTYLQMVLHFQGEEDRERLRQFLAKKLEKA
jgi:signal transduction histidine kinase